MTTHRTGGQALVGGEVGGIGGEGSAFMPEMVELYFRQGNLMYVGPVRSDQPFGQRLIDDNVLSPAMLQEALAAIGTESPTETRLALTLIERGAVRIHTGLCWTSGASPYA